MTDGVTVLFGAVGAVAAVLAVLVPLIRAQGTGLRREMRNCDTEVQMRIMTQGMVGKRLRYKDLAVGRRHASRVAI